MNIGILTSGGDCPGLNAIIRAVVLTATRKGHTVYGFYDGFEGMVQQDCTQLTVEMVRSIEDRGGTILGTTNKGNFGTIGSLKEPDQEALNSLARVKVTAQKLNLHALITIGGDSSLRIAQWVGANAGMNIIGIPKTIDNDIQHTEISVGYNTAVATATDAVNKIQDTGASHKRVMVIEIMGRTAGWLTLETAIASGADVVLIPELPFSYENVVEYITAHQSSRTHACTILVAEGAHAMTDGTTSMHEASKVLTDMLMKKGVDVRLTVLGHIQRGGQPTVFDIVLGSKLGQHAIEMIERDVRECAIMVQNGNLVDVPIKELYAPTRLVPPEHDLVRTARGLGMYFGE